MGSRLLLSLALVLAAGCSSTGPGASSSEPEREPLDPKAAVADPEAVAAPPAAEGHDPEHWTDTTQGAAATLIYVTRRREGGATVPTMIVFTSDPEHPMFRDADTPDCSIKRLKRATMSQLLKQLEGDGLEALPWLDQPRAAGIGPERSLILIQPRRRRRVEKDGLGEAERRAFGAIERRLIAMTAVR